MITRDDIRKLADFESPEGCAVSFFYQPWTPSNKSHKEEAILVKDLVRTALRESERQGKNGFARPDLERIAAMAERLHGNHARAKAIFACAKQNLWQEFDLPPRLGSTHLFMNRRFHLRPLSALAEVLPRVCIALVDRTKARLFQLHMDEISERQKLQNDNLPRRGRSDGWAGYEAGHAERHVANEAMHWFKDVADRLKELHETGGCDQLVIGSRNETWPDFEPHLHPYLRQRLVGHFAVDPANATAEQVRAEAEKFIRERREDRRQGLIREVIGEKKRDGRGATGLRHVLQAMEKGEVQTLLLGRSFTARGVECPKCGHLDSRVVSNCAVCGAETREVSDLSDALLTAAVRNRIEIIHVPEDPALDSVGNIAALLRFRADQNTSAKLAG